MTGTIRTLLDRNTGVTAYCETCGHSAPVDLQALAKRFGKDATVEGSAGWGPATIGGRALTCKECRSANTSIRISPDTPSAPYLPR